VAAGVVKRRAAFLDRDGVVNLDQEYVHRIEDFEFLPGVFEAVRLLRGMGFLPIVTTNQSGIGRGLYDLRQFNVLTDWMKQRFLEEGAELGGVYFCPHHPTEAISPYRHACSCRKPEPGMLLTAASDLEIDLGASALFGDRTSDLEAARRAGIPARYLLGTDAIAMPAEPADPDLATGQFTSLLDAVRSAEFGRFVALPALQP
jgi:D-glycero-D-manno-heptose 1,7-bisphosphate phosphatase